MKLNTACEAAAQRVLIAVHNLPLLIHCCLLMSAQKPGSLGYTVNSLIHHTCNYWLSLKSLLLCRIICSLSHTSEYKYSISAIIAHITLLSTGNYQIFYKTSCYLHKYQEFLSTGNYQVPYNVPLSSQISGTSQHFSYKVLYQCPIILTNTQASCQLGIFTCAGCDCLLVNASLMQCSTISS